MGAMGWETMGTTGQGPMGQGCGHPWDRGGHPSGWEESTHGGNGVGNHGDNGARTHWTRAWAPMGQGWTPIRLGGEHPWDKGVGTHQTGG